ncbi:hypothetical protein GCM10010452_84770 [Crossiella cryophila]
MADPRRCFTCNNKGFVMANCNFPPYTRPCPDSQCPSKGSGQPTPRPTSPLRHLAVAPPGSADEERAGGTEEHKAG